MFSYFLVEWLGVLAKRRAAPRFSVNSRCSKQLFLLCQTQLFSFVELLVFLFVELQLFQFSVNFKCSYLSNFNCSHSSNFNCSHSSNFKYSCSSNFNCSYYCELQLFSLRRTKTSYLRRCILYQESTLLCRLWTLNYTAALKYRCSY